MATKDERPTLLSKVAMFVRNPTKDWSELDRPQHEEESGYDKQALKAMIERKRQNDFVRRREFDQLRKLRRRDASAVAALGRPSLFQTSHATDPDGRAVTLKKIDEIEAQMSKQWWKGKQEGNTQQGGIGSAPPQPAATGVARAPASAPVASVSQLPDHFATTAAPAIVDSVSGDFATTEMGAGMGPGGLRNPATAERGGVLGIESYATADVGFSKSRVFVADEGDMATDPELEEAAIRYANGDDAGAQAGLLEALRGQLVEPSVARSWVAALLDLCRATNNRALFDQSVQEFSRYLDGVQPVWSSLSDPASEPVSASQAGADVSVLWDSPSVLTALAMESLREVMGNSPMPWRLGWSRLVEITPDAMPLLGGLFGSLCNEPVVLRLTGVDRLLQVMQGMTQSGNRNIDPLWWAVRLDVLRTLHRQDSFEMVALDYCVTYEDVPPPWQDGKCTLEGGSPQGEGAALETALQPMDGASVRTLALRGQVTGDASQALTALDGQMRGDDRILVNCQELLRVDFPAAGSILNWVAARQAEGCSVQFRGVHRLVAAFFNVVGINEHAQVVPRAM